MYIGNILILYLRDIQTTWKPYSCIFKVYYQNWMDLILWIYYMSIKGMLRYIQILKHFYYIHEIYKSHINTIYSRFITPIEIIINMDYKNWKIIIIII